MQATSYEGIFESRGASYNAATRYCPHARESERRQLIEMLDLRPGAVVVDVPAGGGYLAEGIVAHQPLAQVICIEPSIEFSKAVARTFPLTIARLVGFPLVDACTDRVGSLAGIHHLEDKQAFFDEVFRLLKPGGVFAVADVKAGSAVARFLDDAVDRLSETGHAGMFLEERELSGLLENAGFRVMDDRYRPCPWRFEDIEQMGTFCKLLFGLVRASVDGVIQEITRALAVAETGSGVEMDWGLIYAAGVKPA
jgi:SAM-dependent methyltransferase